MKGDTVIHILRLALDVNTSWVNNNNQYDIVLPTTL